MLEKFDFIGSGWGFPPTFNKKTATVEMLSDEHDINSSLEILFSTEIGERIMQPTYGAQLKSLLFEPINTSLKAYIMDLIKTAILYHEPRIRLDDISLESKAEEGRLDITLVYTIQNTNSRYNFVYPFYILEGTSINL